MKRFILTFCAILGVFTLPAYSDDVTIAVLDLAGKGVPRIVSNAVSDIIRSEFVNIGNFTVVERSQMAAILEEQGLQMTGCTDSSCAVQFGKILSAKRIVIGEVSKVGKKVVITVRYVDVQSGKSLFSASGTAPSVDEVDIEAKKVAKNLAQRIVEGDKDLITPITKGGYYGRGAVPGWGQIYADRNIKGYIFLGGFILSAAAAGYTVYDYSKKRSDYLDVPAYSPQSEFDSKYDDAKSAGYLALGAVSLTALIYIANWVDVLLVSTPEFTETTASIGKGESNLCFNIQCTSGFSPVREKGYSAGIGLRF